MNAKQTLGELIVKSHFRKQFDKEFSQRQSVWFDTYLQLQEGGDTHSTAVETIRGEIQRERLAR